MSPLKYSVIELQSTGRKTTIDECLPSYRDYITTSLYHFLDYFVQFYAILRKRKGLISTYIKIQSFKHVYFIFKIKDGNG